jgi:hypothetical protein
VKLFIILDDDGFACGRVNGTRTDAEREGADVRQRQLRLRQGGFDATEEPF